MKPDLKTIVEEASLAPSVHNIQPVRWVFDDDRLILMRDRSVRLPHGDPTDRDVMISAGACLEGAAIAASRQGFSTRFEAEKTVSESGAYQHLGALHFSPGGEVDALAAFVESRRSWRGPFERATDEDRERAVSLGGSSCAIFAGNDDVRQIGRLADGASLRFMADADFREELVSWMRFKPVHPHWSRDGLNAKAMHMSGFEALAAFFVLGRTFGVLHKLGLAGFLVSEAKRYSRAAGFLLVHRPVEETPLESGRHFYRHWLEIEKAGFSSQVVAALTDDAETCAVLHKKAGLSNDRKLLTAFVFGKPLVSDVARDEAAARARLPVEEIIIPDAV
ncbi:MAG: hypothetical protein AAGE89_00280 [Pseudomonadota bacterium]